MKFHLITTVSILLLSGCSDQSTVEESQSIESEEHFIIDDLGLRHDPIENSPEHKVVFEKIDEEVEELLKDHPRKGKIGFIHIVWQTKQERLKEVYGIDWRAPSELNPAVSFD